MHAIIRLPIVSQLIVAHQGLQLCSIVLRVQIDAVVDDLIEP